MRKWIPCSLALLGLMMGATTQFIVGQESSLAQKGKVVIYRPKRFLGSGLTPSVYVDEKQLARMDNGRYISFAIPVGERKFASSMKHDPLLLTVKDDKPVYLEMLILAGNWRGGGRLVPVSEADGLEAIKKLKPLDRKWITAPEMLFGAVESQPEKARP